MADGSSSAAPVMSPGPRLLKNPAWAWARAGFGGISDIVSHPTLPMRYDVDGHADSATPFREQSRLGPTHQRARSGLFSDPFGPAVAEISLDRLLRQPRPAQRARRSSARGALCPSQRRQRRRPLGFELLVRAAIRH